MGCHGGDEAEGENYGIVKNVESQAEFSAKCEPTPALKVSVPKAQGSVFIHLCGSTHVIMNIFSKLLPTPN